MTVILFECHLQVPQARLGPFKTQKSSVVKIKEIVAALLLALVF